MAMNGKDYFETRLREAEGLLRNDRSSAIVILKELRDYPSINTKTRLYVDFLLGKALYLCSKYEDASKIFDDVLQKAEGIFGKNHSFTLLIIGFLARSESHQGKHKESAILYLKESFLRTGRTPMDIKMISESYELYCREKEACYKGGTINKTKMDSGCIMNT